MNSLLSIIVLSLILISCKKAEDRTCWKANGDVTITEINLNHLSYKGIKVFDNIDVNLIADTTDFMVINSYENRINHFTYLVVDNLLELRDESNCHFLRNTDKKTTIDIHYSNISIISLKGTGLITSKSPIVNNDYLHIHSHNCNGEIDIEVNTSSLQVKLVNGTLNGQIIGRAINAEIFHFGYSNVNFEELLIDNLNITNKSDADVYVTSNSTLAVELLSLGDIYYKGNPTTEILTNSKGSKLINNN